MESPQLRYFRERYRESVERTFAAVSDLYAEYWNDYFHFALFPSKDASWDEAFEHTHREYARALQLQHARKVLELACGRGGFARFLAKNSDADVLAVDWSRTQLARARKHQLPNLRFRRQDVMEIDTLGDTFDAVVCLDAACYLPDKRLAVERIASVVAPGGRFLLVDWCRREGLSRLQEELVLLPFMESWAIPSLETAAGYVSHVQRAGLRLVETRDLNDMAAPNWELGYRRALDGIEELDGVARLAWKGLRVGRRGIPIVKDQFRAALYIKAGFDSGFLRYTLVLAEKPPV